MTDQQEEEEMLKKKMMMMMKWMEQEEEMTEELMKGMEMEMVKMMMKWMEQEEEEMNEEKQQQEDELSEWMKKMEELMKGMDMVKMKEGEERMKKMKEETMEKEEEEIIKEMIKEVMKEEERMKKMKEEMMEEEEEIMKEEMKEEEIKEDVMKEINDELKKIKDKIKKMKEEEKDSVWGNFIPSIYFEIIAKSSLSTSSSTTTTTTSLLGGFSSKKDLCCSLYDKPILIEDDSKSFGIEKRSAKICFMLGARALSIEWGSDPRYWTWRPSSNNESRFPEVVNLLKVSWLAITGKVETRMLSPKTMYGAYFVIKIAEQNYGLDRLPVQFSMKFVRGGGECSEAGKVFLKRGETQQQQQQQQQQQEGEFPHERGDGWMEIEMGEFFNDGEEDGEVEMYLFEIDNHWKSGLIIQGMELRPKVST